MNRAIGFSWVVNRPDCAVPRMQRAERKEVGHNRQRRRDGAHLWTSGDTFVSPYWV